MTVCAIRQNDGNSRLNNIVRSTAAGTVAGYAAKWLWPVTKSEDTVNRRVMINYCRKVTNKAKAQEFENLGNRTKAQDMFIKMVKQGYEDIPDKAGKPVKTSVFKSEEIAKRVKSLGGEDSKAGKELRGIIRNVNESSTQMLKRFGISYKMMLKYIRQPIPFLVAGAGIGFFTGFAHNVMKCDYDA